MSPHTVFDWTLVAELQNYRRQQTSESDPTITLFIVLIKTKKGTGRRLLAIDLREK